MENSYGAFVETIVTFSTYSCVRATPAYYLTDSAHVLLTLPSDPWVLHVEDASSVVLTFSHYGYEGVAFCITTYPTISYTMTGQESWMVFATN